MSVIEAVRATWLAVGVHALLGLAFAGAFLSAGLPRVDPAARGAGFGFRLLILPGVVALWPLMAWRWWRSIQRREPPQPSAPDGWARAEDLRRWHRTVWTLLAVTGPVVLAISLAWRPTSRVTSGLPVLNPAPSQHRVPASGQ